MALALFDLDNTLIAGDSDHSWGEFLVEQGIVDAEHFASRNDQFYQDYLQGNLVISEYLKFALAPLAGKNLDTLAQWHQKFMEIKIKPLMLPKAKQLLEHHKQLGHRLVIITSTNSFVATPICNTLGVDDNITSEAEVSEGKYTGRSIGTPCYREGKVKRLQSWLSEQELDLSGSFAYTDSINDLPLLYAVENPVVVDGDELLKKKALEEGWPCISLR